MSDELHSMLKFKFFFLNDKGQQASMFRRRGEFDGAALRLHQTEIPVTALLQIVVREQRMVLVHLDDRGAPTHTAILPSSKSVTSELKRRIDIARSAVWAEGHRASLEQQGRGAAFRVDECPHCTATLVLTDLPITPQLYCHFCDSLATVAPGATPPAGEQHLRLCEQCGRYSRPAHFTILYFYFLVVFFGYWSKSTWRCHGCMRREAWKMFFGNLPFLLGLPGAIVQLVRSYSGTVLGGPFRGLDAANLQARKGNASAAISGYRDILERVQHSAGVKYNVGLALLQLDEHRPAAQSFELALADCANYSPAYRLVTKLYAQLGEQAKLRELQRIWGDVEAAERKE